MATYIITAETTNAATYEKLYGAVKSYGTWARITEWSWAVVSDKKSTEVRDHLEQYLARGDRLLVVRSGTESAWGNVRCNSEWLQEHL